MTAAFSSAQRKKELYIFVFVFIYGFIVQLLWVSPSETLDKLMWTNQIQYFLTEDPRMFNFYAAYAHPGTTLVGLGSLLHILLEISYRQALLLSMSLLIAGASAACAVVCARLCPGSLWWVATAFTLLFTRFHICSTPPTSVVLPFLVLIVLVTWNLVVKAPEDLFGRCFLWGCVVGVSAATRVDATALFGGPMFMIVLVQYGWRTLLPIILGVTLSFYLADPFLWFMPMQHLADLLHKFSIHYEGFLMPSTISAEEWFLTVPLALVSFIWFAVITVRKKPSQIVPPKIIWALLVLTLLALWVILTSSYQSIRYVYPLLIVWEVLFPVVLLEKFSPSGETKVAGTGPHLNAAQLWVLGAVVATQVLAYVLSVPIS